MPAIRRGRGEGETTQAVARDDAYIYLLGISLAAMIIGCIFLYMDWDSFTQGKPQAPSVTPAPRGAINLPGAEPPAPPAPAPGKTS